MPIDAVTDAQLRELASLALKQTVLFAPVSWRLMSDFVHAIGEIDRLETARPTQDLDLVVVLRSPVRVRAGSSEIALGPGVHFGNQPPLLGTAGTEIQADPLGDSAIYFVKDWSRVADSWALARSLDLAGLPAAPSVPIDFASGRFLELAGRPPAAPVRIFASGLYSAVAQAKTELNFVAFSDRLLQSFDPLVSGYVFQHLLATAVSRSPGSVLSIVWDIHGDGHFVEEWQQGSLVFTRQGPAAVRARYEDRSPSLPPLDRVYLSAPGSTQGPGPVLDGLAAGGLRRALSLHRVVFVTDDPQEGAPTHSGAGGRGRAGAASGVHGLLQWLPANLRQHPGLFTSMVEVLLAPDRPAPPAPEPAETPETVGGELRQVFGNLYASAVRLLERRSHFETRPIGVQRSPESAKDARLLRDAARITLDPLDALQLFQAWTGYSSRPASLFLDPPFGERLFAARPSTRTSAEQTGRALTGKRVGIAVGGGGASAFRIGPLLEMLEQPDTQVPVDYYAGVSGGAMVGAYYCALGTAGIRQLAQKMDTLQWLVPLLPLASWPLEAWVDSDLQGRRVEDLTTPAFLPVSLKLAGKAAPQAVTILSGTLGEAVRASGSAPLLFGPTQKRRARFTDGAAAMVVPKDALNGYADIILASDIVPAPLHSNPWYDVAAMRFVHDRTLVGRAIDGWMWVASLLENAASGSAVGATVYLIFDRVPDPLMESGEWGCAQTIVNKARLDRHVSAAAQKLYAAFKAPPKPPAQPPAPSKS